MKHNPLITIVTVCFNSEETICDTLKSVASQSYKNFEHIIIDGVSTDTTLEKINTWNKHKIILYSEKDHGIYDAMNKGISLAKGDIVGFLNSDDVYAGNNVLKIIAQAMSNPSVDASYGDLVYVDRFNLKKVRRYWKSSQYKPRLFENGWVVPHPTFYVKRKIYSKYGNFDTKLKLAADFDLILRLLCVYSVRSVYIPTVLVKMRLGGASNASFLSIYSQNKEIIRSFKKYGLNVGVKFFICRIALKVLQFIRKLYLKI